MGPTFGIAFDGKRLEVEQNATAIIGADVPVTTVGTRAAIIFFWPFWAGENAARRSRYRQITATVCRLEVQVKKTY